MKPDSPERALSTDWVLWAIDNLSAGATVADVVDELNRNGVARDDATNAIARIVESPIFHSLRTDLVRGAMAERVLRAWPRRFESIERVESLDRDAFYWRHFLPMRPVIITSQLRSMRACGSWDFASLRNRFGACEIAATARREGARRPAEVEGHSEKLTFGELLDHAEHGEGNDRYLVARNGLLLDPAFRSMRDDLAPLPPFLETGRDDASWTSLWIGPRGTRTPLHFDPHAAILVQVRGRKRVRLVPPTETWLYEIADGYFARDDLASNRPQAHPDYRASAVLDVVVDEGEAIFLPALWWHEVDALTPSITVTMLSFPWANDFHSVVPHHG